MAIFQGLVESITLQTSLSSLLFATLFLIVVFRSFGKKKKHNLPPGLPKLPIIGNLHQVGNNPHLSFYELSKKLGPIMHLQLGEIPTVVISTAKMAREVMKTHDLALSNRPQLFSAKYLFYNCSDMAFSQYGAHWRHIRKISILEVLSAKRVQSFSFIRAEEVASLVDGIAKGYPGTTDLSKFLAMYSNNIICRASLGRGFTEGGEYDKHGFQKMLEEYQELLGGFSVGDYFPSKEWVYTFTGMKARLEKVFKQFDSFFDTVIAEHQDPNREKVEHKDLIDVLLDLQKSESLEMPLTMDNIKAIIMDMFAAGSDTTFITLDWGMTELVMNPKVLKKAQAEVRSIVGERKTVLESDLAQMEYLKCVIKEIFRLHPPAPVLVPRESMEEVIVNGYTFPTKTRFVVNAWAIGRDPEAWKDPYVFEPGRFIGSPIDFKGQDYELIPFGTGRRICPAITFGTSGVEIALAQLLHSFDWELPPGVKPQDLDMREVFGITMHRASHLIVVAKPHFQ